MKIETAKVTDFSIEPGPSFHVRAMVEIKPAGDPRRRLIWVELDDQEAKVMQFLVTQVEQRLASHPPNIFIEEEVDPE